MKLPKLPTEESSATSPASPKNFWTSVLAFTPVALTVVATILAGLSSSEMTLAQYDRSLAAQFQSKAGDQWNFFQAKRIRGTTLEATLDLLRSGADTQSVDASLLHQTAEQLVGEFHRAQTMLEKAGPSIVGKEPWNTLSKRFAGWVAAAEQARQQLDKDLEAAGMQSALACLNGKDPPAANVQLLTDPSLGEALEAIRQRRPEAETTALVRRLAAPVLEQAVEAGENNIREVEASERPISDALTRLDRWVERESALARDWQRTLKAIAPKENDKAEASLRDALLSRGLAARQSVDLLRTSFKAARHDYNAQRYRREAGWNERAAAIYELQVRKSASLSEGHRQRSKRLFYGMLAAQAGVTIASFALAVRHKSLLWTLASLTGVGAGVFGAYVYFYM